MNFRPLGNRVLVKQEEEESMTPGGLIIPPSAQEKPQLGKIMAVGKGTVLEDGTVRPVELKAGDTILFGKYTGTDIRIEGKGFLIMPENDVLGVVEG